MDREDVDTYQVLTPWGEVIRVLFQDERPMPVYRGSEAGVALLRDHIRRCVGEAGIGLMPETVTPSQLMSFCQPNDSGYLVVEPFDVAAASATAFEEPAEA